MKNTILRNIAAYKNWRRGVLAFTIIELLIAVAIIAVLIVMIMAQIKSKTPAKCSLALAELKRFVDDLNTRIILDGDKINPAAERTKMQELMNKINEECNDPQVTNAGDIKSALDQLNGLITERISGSDNPSGWQNLKDSITTFFGKYFGG